MGVTFMTLLQSRERLTTPTKVSGTVYQRYTFEFTNKTKELLLY
jgi:hypothetical protein